MESLKWQHLFYPLKIKTVEAVAWKQFNSASTTLNPDKIAGSVVVLKIFLAEVVPIDIPQLNKLFIEVFN